MVTYCSKSLDAYCSRGPTLKFTVYLLSVNVTISVHLTMHSVNAPLSHAATTAVKTDCYC